MSDQATDGSSHGGNPTRGQWTDGEATPKFSTNTNELLSNIGSQFSDPRRQSAQRGQAGRPDRGDVYEHRNYTERYERSQQHLRPGISRSSQPQQRQLEQGPQARENCRRLEEQQCAEIQLRGQHRRHEERLTAQRSTGRELYPPKSTKGEDESCHSRRRQPR